MSRAGQGTIPPFRLERSWRYRSPVAVRYAMALLLVFLAWTITFVMRRSVDAPSFQTPFFVCAIVLGSWIGGVGPGLLATLVSIFAIEFTLTEPRYTFGFTLDEVPKFTVFFITAAFISWLAGRQRRDQEALLVARESLEDKVRERTRDLEIANERLTAEIDERIRAQTELERISRVTTMGELTASIAHEMNQPLAAVITNANACTRWLDRDPADLEEAREALRRIIRDGKRGSEVISRIRALLKKQAPVHEPLAIDEMVDEILVLTRSELDGISIEKDLDAMLPLVPADRVQIQQVLLNLVLNANDAMKSVPRRTLRITARRGECGGIEVAVSDSGVGLTVEGIDRVFQTFYTTKPEGLGMGLAICRSIVEQHGGRLWAEANDGAGATFRFTLPLEEAA